MGVNCEMTTNTFVYRVRKLAGDGCNAGGGGGNNLTTPRYQLAEHRYGREEMLALFDRNYKAPDPLTGFTGLYVPKPQLPLALINMTEEENVSNTRLFFVILLFIIIILTRNKF